jgi:ureidoacrylate peracid hydrolase
MTDWQLDPQRTALVIVDVQNDYAHKEGHLGKKMGMGVQRARKILPTIRKLIDCCKSAGAFVVWVQSVRTDQNCEKARHKISPPRFADGWLGGPKINTFGSQIIDEIKPSSPDDVVVQKWRNSAFFKTALEQILRNKGIDTLLMVGIATNVCVESTLRDAYFRDFDIVLVKDGCFAPSRREHLGTIRRVESSYGAVATSDEVMRKLMLKIVIRNNSKRSLVKASI